MEENVPDDVPCTFCVASTGLTHVSRSTEETSLAELKYWFVSCFCHSLMQAGGCGTQRPRHLL